MRKRRLHKFIKVVGKYSPCISHISAHLANKGNSSSFQSVYIVDSLVKQNKEQKCLLRNIMKTMPLSEAEARQVYCLLKKILVPYISGSSPVTHALCNLYDALIKHLIPSQNHLFTHHYFFFIFPVGVCVCVCVCVCV